MGVGWHPTRGAAQAPPQGDAVTMQELGYGDITVGGVHPQVDIFVPGPGVLAARDATLRLVTSHSDQLDAIRSGIRVEWNGLPVYAQGLGRTGAARSVREIRIPADRIRPAVNQIRVAFSLWFPDDVCADPDHPGRFAVVYRESALDYGTPIVGPRPEWNLGLFPASFVREGSPVPSRVTVVLPDEPGADELSAAATVAGQMTRLAPFARFEFVSSPSAPSGRSAGHLIAVGTPERNPLVRRIATQLGVRLSDNGVLLPDGSSGVAEGGLLLLGPSPDDPGSAALAVTGLSPEGIGRAAGVMGNRKLLRGLSGQWAEIREVAEPGHGGSGTESLSLFPTGLALDGVQQTEINARVVLPPIARAETLAVTLDISRSANLDVGYSYLRLSVNGEPTGLTIPASSDETYRTARLAVPARFVKSGANTFTLAARIRPRVESCAAIISAEREAFLRVAPGVLVELPGPAAVDRSTLASWPHPLAGGATGRPNLVASLDGIAALLATAGILGSLASGDALAFSARLAGPDDPLPDADALMVLGSWDRLPHRSALAPSLPVTFDGSVWTLGYTSPPVAQVGPAVSPAVLELASLEGKEVLVLTATDPARLNLAVRALGGALPDAVAVFVYEQEEGVRIEPMVPADVTPTPQRGYSALGAASAVLAALAAAIMGLMVLGARNSP